MVAMALQLSNCWLIEAAFRVLSSTQERFHVFCNPMILRPEHHYHHRAANVRERPTTLLRKGRSVTFAALCRTSSDTAGSRR
jgi:hypothetical protein